MEEGSNMGIFDSGFLGSGFSVDPGGVATPGVDAVTDDMIAEIPLESAVTVLAGFFATNGQAVSLDMAEVGVRRILMEVDDLNQIVDSLVDADITALFDSLGD